MPVHTQPNGGPIALHETPPVGHGVGIVISDHVRSRGQPLFKMLARGMPLNFGHGDSGHAPLLQEGSDFPPQ
eukprot:12673832-Alexandrium_andersonii.AAC.1